MATGGIRLESMLSSAMRVAEMNHRIIANNIANADTPHFTPTELDFERTLKAEMAQGGHVGLRTSRSRHLDRSRIVTDIDRMARLSKNDYNMVDLEEQLTKLAENRSRYTMYSQLLGRQFRRTNDMLDMLGR